VGRACPLDLGGFEGRAAVDGSCVALGRPVCLAVVVSFIREFTVSRAKNAYASTVPAFLWLADRVVTSFEHVLRDFEDGPEWSREMHYLEIGRVVEKLDGEALEEYVNTSLRTHRNTHFHAWDFDGFAELLFRARTVVGVDYDIQEVISTGHHELISVIQKPYAKATSLDSLRAGFASRREDIHAHQASS
jgi:hypothetical protein